MENMEVIPSINVDELINEAMKMSQVTMKRNQFLLIFKTNLV